MRNKAKVLAFELERLNLFALVPYQRREPSANKSHAAERSLRLAVKSDCLDGHA
jgi:hypothetical protein